MNPVRDNLNMITKLILTKKLFNDFKGLAAVFTVASGDLSLTG